MRIRYSLPPLSEKERERLIGILLEEMETQRWFTVAVSIAFGRELILALQ